MKKRTKFTFLYVSIVALFAILAGRLWYLQVVQARYYAALADTSKQRVDPIPAPRGIIVDNKGRSLVYNVPSWDVEVVPHGIPPKRAHTIYRALSAILHGQPSPRKIASDVHRARFQPYEGTIIKPDVLTSTAMVVEEMHLQLPGVRAVAASKRSYSPADPNWSLSHILGYTSGMTPGDYPLYRKLYPKERVQPTDQEGSTGVELAADPYLHGINGRDIVEVDAGERPIRVLKHVAPVPGDKVYLTLNWKLQQEVSRDLAAALQKLNLRQGAVVMEDPNTGRILAMVSLPSYNNNLFEPSIKSRAFSALLHDPAHPLVDLATQGQLPPGSTYKIITAAAGLQSGAINASTTIDDTGVIKLCSASDSSSCQPFYGWWPPPGLGPVNVVKALAESSDIFFYTVAGGNPNDGKVPHVGPNKLAYWARQFGLGSDTGIELPNEFPGLVPSATWYNHLHNRILRAPGTYWTIGQTYNMGIGQGFNEATPLQMAGVASTIANGGTLYRPRIIQKIDGRVVPRRGATSHDRIIQPFVPSVVRSHFLNPETVSLIQRGMHESVTLPLALHGTSFNVTDPRIDAAGKTGTAEDLPHPAHAWWVGYAPYNHPRVAISVVVPYANSEGAYVAAPIAHKCLEDFFHLAPTKANWLDDVIQFLVPGGAQ